MRLTILGSSGGYPGPDNPASGFLVEHATARLWLDAGNGTFGAFQRVAEVAGLDALLVSHVHPDHCADLYSLFIALRYRREGVLQKSLYCPREVWERVPLLLGDAPELREGFGRAFDFHAIDEGDAVEVGGVRATFLRTDHPAHCLAMRLESDSGILTYSADTGPGTDLAGFARGSDLLLCEATYQEAHTGAPVHLTAREAGETARRAGVKRLVLTHVWPDLDPRLSVEEARQTAGGIGVEWAAPGASFDVRSPG